MSWFVLKKAKTVVYLPNDAYGMFVDQYAERNQWSIVDRMDFHIAGKKRNKEKKRINNFIIDSMTNEWEHDIVGFLDKYSFVYHADAIERHLYELIWSFCEVNPRYQMLAIRSGIAIKPTHVDVNLSVTYGKDFYVSESHGLIRKILAESKYRIKTDTIMLLYGNMADFRICFKNGVEYRFHTLLDGRKSCGAISVDIGDTQEWETMLQKAEEERLVQEKANAPERIISTEEYQETSVAFAHLAFKKYYEEMLDIEQEYDRCAMTPNAFVDFSVYEQKWSDLAERTKEKHDDVVAYQHLWSKQPNRDFKATGFYNRLMDETWQFYYSIYLYCNDMAQMMHHLHEKAHGSRYRMKDYMKELEKTKVRRGNVDIHKGNMEQTKQYLAKMNN